MNKAFGSAKLDVANYQQFRYRIGFRIRAKETLICLLQALRFVDPGIFVKRLTLSVYKSLILSHWHTFEGHKASQITKVLVVGMY